MFEAQWNWKYENEFSECVNIELFNSDELEKIAWFFSDWYMNAKIESDISFKYRWDDSIPKHYVFWKKLSDWSDYNLHLNYPARDNTTLTLSSTFDTILCEGSTGTNVCWTHWLPTLNTLSDPIFLYKVKLQANCDGATTLWNWWYRNQFTFKGTYYRLLLK